MHISQKEFVLLRQLIEEQCGILLDDTKAYLIENRLSGLAQETGCKSFSEFYLKLKNSPQSYQMREQMIEAMTTNETLWFRDKYPFTVLSKKILPEYREKIEKGKQTDIQIWCAGCSSGQEPYSIAIAAIEFYRDNGLENQCHKEVSILATDISSKTLAIAKKAEYDDIVIKRGLPDNYLDRYFERKGNIWTLHKKVQQLVNFKQHNLQDSFHRLGQFDIIFLRNVMIYFSDNLKKQLFQRVSNILKPEGYLFLGTGETIQGYTTRYDIIKQDGGILFKVKL